MAGTSSACAGADPCSRPEEGDTEIPVGDDLALVLRGRPLPAADRRVLGAFAAQAAIALKQQRLAEAAAEAAPLAAADRTRTALLSAVSHDLRTPLSSAKAAVTSLRSADIDWSVEERAELLATADESLDRLIRLVENLLDVSRLQAGAVSVFVRPDRARRDRAAGPRRPRGSRARACRSRWPMTCPRSSPTRLCSSASSPTSRRTRSATRRPTGRRSSPPARSRTGSSCGSSTADRASPRPTGSGSSPRSSGSATATTRRASDSGWPCPEGSSSRWAGRSRRRTPPAEG